MPEEISELQEHAEHGAEDHSLAPVTITMAILAVLVAAVSLLGHRGERVAKDGLLSSPMRAYSRSSGAIAGGAP